jgi:hypothetical protein
MSSDETAQDVHLQYIRGRVDEILAQARLTNGRLQAAERELAVLKADAERSARVGAGGLISGIGSGIALAASLLWDHFRH